MKSLLNAVISLSLLAVMAIGCGGSGGGSASSALPSFPEMPSKEAETKAITKSMESFQAALKAKDVAAAAELFTPEVRDDMQKWLTAHKEILPELATPLVNLPVSSLSDEYGWQKDGDRRRSAEVSVLADGTTFYITLEKVDGRWLVRTF